MNTRRLRNLPINSLLAIASISASLLCIELALRMFVPQRYEDVQAPIYVPDATKMWAPRKNSTVWTYHPDTREPIPIVTNNLGIRMERDVLGSELASTVNVAVFGASYA